MSAFFASIFGNFHVSFDFFILKLVIYEKHLAQISKFDR
jgi:hypothetical protein